jgi:hypothetical protein
MRLFWQLLAALMVVWCSHDAYISYETSKTGLLVFNIAGILLNGFVLFMWAFRI